MGFSQGVMPLVSYNFASGDRKRMKKSILFAMSVILPVMASITLCYWVFGPGLVRSFMDNPEIVTYGASFLRGMSLSMAFMCVDFMAVGVFQALGMGKNALVFAILRKIVLEIPLLIILNAIFPLYGLPAAQLVAEIVLCIVALVIMRRLLNESKIINANNDM
jgi:Na+-driven multidrug efflux pump